MKSLLRYLLLFFIGGINAIQAQDLARLAKSLYDKQDFQKAAIIYEDLYTENPKNNEYYEYLIQSWVQTNEFKKAKKTIRKHAKITTSPLLAIVDECWVTYRENPDAKQYEKLFILILEKTQDQLNLALLAAERFKMRQMPDEAIEILIQAEDLYGPNPRITNEIALLELEKGNRLQALERYLDMMVRSNTPYDQLKRIFDTYITDTADILALQDMLLNKIKQYPHIQGLSEWLKWTFIQLQDWDKAFIYTRSLDLRLKEDGFRMFELAYLCSSNGDLNTALKCLDYIIKKGEFAYNYYESKGRWFEITFQLSQQQNMPLTPEFDQNISTFIRENGPSNSTLPSAIIWSKRLVQKQQIDSAYSVLLNYINAPFLDKKTHAEAKLSLADLQIEQGEMYQSELWLAQVEKEFKDDPIGQKAKFKRAELSFFRGDYDWANMQLDVLKGATTQLISNDAMELSLCITDNLGIDSNYNALEWYSKAKLLERQHQFQGALQYLDSITTVYPENSLADEVLFLKAQLKLNQNEYAEAANLLGILIEMYPDDILADNALYMLAQIQQFKLLQPEKALKTYETLIVNYTQSLFTAEARIQFRKLRGF